MAYTFKVDEALDEVVDYIKKISVHDKFTKVVIGISGGKDSTIAAALCCRALGKENVHGLLLPNGMQSDIDDALRVCQVLGIRYDTVNIKPIYDSYLLQATMCISKRDYKVVDSEESLDGVIEKMGKSSEMLFCPSQDALYNLPPRIRMSMIRLWGQTNHHRMCGTSNHSEITVGYCTKDGDTSNDFNPLARLTSIEVVQIGLAMKELPKDLVVKTPADGLCGVSDEEKIGISYENIHKYIRGMELDLKIWNQIHALELAGLHKRSKTEYIPSKAVLSF